MDACTTRLRLVVANQAEVDVEALKQLGARGIVRPTEDALQVVLGPIADQVADEIRAGLRGEEASLLAALGGRENVRTVETVAGRVLVTVAEDAAVDEAALRALGARGIARPARGSVHVLLGTAANTAGESLRRLIL